MLRGRAMGRAELARALGLSKTALGALAGELLEQGLLLEQGPVPARRGRRPAPLSINARHAGVIGVNLSVTACEFGVYDLLGSPLHLETTPSGRGEGQAGVYRRILLGVRRAVDHARRAGLNPSAIGVASSGPLDARAGVILDPPNFPELRRLPLAEWLARDVGLPVRLERNTSAAATAYQRQGGAANFIYLLLLDRGIGAGIVIGGQVYRGVHGYAGEFGHISLEVDGPACPCGNRGCLERVADVGAIEEAYRERGGRAVPFGRIVERAEEGEAPAQETLGAAGRAIGLAAVSLVNLLDPQLLVLGGMGARASPFLVPALRSELVAHAYPYLRWGEELEILTCPLENPALLGAAEGALNAIYRGEIAVPPIGTALA